MSDSTEAKTEDATPRKLRKLREDGTTPNASDLVSNSGGIATLLALMLIASNILIGFDSQFLAAGIIHEDEFISDYRNAIELAVSQLIRSILPIVGATVFAAFLTSVIYQKGIVFSFKPVAPKFERINPAMGVKRIFGRRGWIENGVGLVKASLWFIAAGFVVWSLVGNMLSVHFCGMPCVVQAALKLTIRFLIIALLFLIIFNIVDAILQKNIYLHENKMTKTETKREQKEQHGSPEVRSARKRSQREALEEAGKIGLNKANMYFFSNGAFISMKYHPKDEPVPRMTSKALDEAEAAKMLQKSAELGLIGMRHDRIVSVMSRQMPGQRIPEEIFEDTAKSIGQMFGKR